MQIITGGGGSGAIPAEVATDAELAAALAAHEAAANPHPVYEASAEIDGHEAAVDPHAGYRLESADHSHQSTGLQGGVLADAAIPATITRDSELTAALTAHEGAADPHAGYETEAASAAALAAHEAAGDPHAGYQTEVAAAAALGNHEAAPDPHAGYLKESDFAGVDFLVGTATGLTTNEIVAGTSPGGELGGTWAAPTVDASHAGSTHGAAVTTHEAAADPHSGYRLESADHSHASSGAQAGQVAHSDLTGLTAGDPHTQYQRESEKSAASGYASLDAGTKVPTAELGTGTADSTVFLRGDQVWGAPTAAHPNLATHDALGLATDAELATHAAAADPHTVYRLESADHSHASTGAQGGTIAHSAMTGLSSDDHPQYQREAEKSAASGYASLDATTKVPTAELGTGTPSSAVFLRGDRTWDAPVAAHADLATHDALGLATDAELTAHAGAADPHTGYRLESADHTHESTGLQGGVLADAAIPSTIARDTEVAAAVTAHEGLANPHPTYETAAEAAAQIATHAGLADPHTGYRLESADHSHASTGLQAGQVSHADLTNLATGDPHTQYRLEADNHSHATSGAQGGTVSHADLTNLTTGDPHTQYLKEKASGGTAAETPAHNHSSAAEAGVLDHGSGVTGLTDDDHTQYALLAGRSGGQTLIGGTATGNKLILQANSIAGSDGEVEILSTATGAFGPLLSLYHDSASPAPGDATGLIAFYAEDAGGTKTVIAALTALITETLAAAMSANLRLTALDDGVQRHVFLAPDSNALYPGDDAHWDLGIVASNRFRSAFFSSIVDVGTGFRIAGAAAQGNFLTGNGTNYVADTGAWTPVTFAAGNFTVTGGGAWTLTSPDQTTLAYRLFGKTMVVAFALDATSVTATASTLEILIPASKVANRTVANAMAQIYDNGARTTGECRVTAGGTKISIYRTDAAAFTASANNTYIYGEITFEVQ